MTAFDTHAEIRLFLFVPISFGSLFVFATELILQRSRSMCVCLRTQVRVSFFALPPYSLPSSLSFRSYKRNVDAISLRSHKRTDQKKKKTKSTTIYQIHLSHPTESFINVCDANMYSGVNTSVPNDNVRCTFILRRSKRVNAENACGECVMIQKCQSELKMNKASTTEKKRGKI